MARIQDPTLFSKHFGIDHRVIADAGFIDVFIDVDTPLFIDPVLLEKSSHEIIRTAAIETFRTHFTNFVRLLRISKRVGDPAWIAAQRLLDLREPPENGLGYGGSGRSGNSRPEDIRHAIMQTSKEIIELGSEDPEMVSLMGFFEEGVGPDTISDFTTRVILPQLAALTSEFCKASGVEVHNNPIVTDVPLPRFLDSNGKSKFLVLVPRDIVRDLPIARDWNDVIQAAYENEQIRNRVNAMLGGIAQPTIADQKAALRSAAMESAENFAAFLAAVKEFVSTYDSNIDALAYYKLQSMFAEGVDEFKTDKPYDLSPGPAAVKEVVLETLDVFRHHVENGNLWEELWMGNKPKKERAAQLIYYAMADAFCRANKIDISPEANMGGGPVDFKFSKGYDVRVLVEMKRSSGTVRHGYEKQLDIYKNAARTEIGIFVVMDFGDLGDKIDQIYKIRADRIAAGDSASDILVIDATKKASASKRK